MVAIFLVAIMILASLTLRGSVNLNLNLKGSRSDLSPASRTAFTSWVMMIPSSLSLNAASSRVSALMLPFKYWVFLMPFHVKSGINVDLVKDQIALILFNGQSTI